MTYSVHTTFSTSRFSVNPQLRLALHVVVLAALMLCLATTAHAAGSSMPWEGPLQSILESIQGPVARIVAVIIIISTGLALAEGTVKNYVTNMLGKIGARDRTQAALRARELGLI